MRAVGAEFQAHGAVRLRMFSTRNAEIAIALRQAARAQQFVSRISDQPPSSRQRQKR